MKRAFSDKDLQSMPSKRRRFDRPSKFRYRFSSKSAGVPRAFSSNSCIIPLTVEDDLALTADISRGYGFSATNLWVNGVSSTAIPGASDITALFDLVRIKKIEITILPGANELAYPASTVGTGVQNIPFVLEAYDPTDSTNPSAANMRELATCRSHLLDKVIRRNIYPCVKDASGIINVGLSRKDTFIQSGTDLPYFGWKVYADMVTNVWTYNIVRISFKVYFECRQSK